MKTRYKALLPVLLILATVLRLAAQDTPAKTPLEVLTAALTNLVNVIEPVPGTPPQTFSATVKVLKADGLAKELVGRSARLAFQAPDHLLLSLDLDKASYTLGRDGQQLWIHAPAKKFGVIGQPGLPRFASAPDKLDDARLGPVKLPLPRAQVLVLPMLMKVDALPSEEVGGVRCRVVKAVPQPPAIEAFKLPNAELTLWVRETDFLPARIGYFDGKKANVVLELQNVKLAEAWPTEKWQLQANAGDKIEAVALSHVRRFIPALFALLNQNLPTLGPAKGERRLVVSEGKGRLEVIDDTKVLFLKGSPAEMGQQHGALMRKPVKNLVDRILYGVGVGSSFDKGRWFFGEIEQAQKRLAPFIDDRYLQEMDAMAAAAGLEKEEVRLANFFPELFHCSGFALFGDATVGGRMYHGRILDYMKGVGLEPNATVIVHQPDYGHAWVNVSYAGFIGSVTAMNEKHISVGEMGGRGEGNWDGKPMAQLVREVMEKSDSLDEAVELMRKGPRTCEYFYVIADGKARKAVGIAATPTTFEVIKPGEAHPRLPHPFKDAVLMSAGDRHEKLAERVKDGYGKFDADSARHLMDRPVAMTSNIHSALFAPDTLDFWVANADSKNVASHTRYTHYNLAELLKPSPLSSR
ncbi:MAG: hypothetical protein HYY24_16310 [Verrucomicrobia bacterium]|nr:hypothetical protein [Verrucomicrobiota bacterium]